MAASVATALDPAVRKDAQSEPTTEDMPQRHEPEEIGAALALVSVAKEPSAAASTAPNGEEGSQRVSEQPASASVALEGDNGPMEAVNGEPTAAGTPAAAGVVVDAVENATEDAAKEPVGAASAPLRLVVGTPGEKASRSRSVTPTSAKSKKAENALGIATSKKKAKKKKKKQPEPSHPCVGLYIDALDKNSLWGNARIADVDVANQKIKVTFPGYNPRSWDLWTDLLSIAPHGTRCTPVKGGKSKSWDGLTDLFTGERTVGADSCTSPEVHVKQEVVIAPSKPARAIKKGYKLEVIPDSEADQPALKTAQSSKRKLPAARESPVVATKESPAQKTATSPNAKRPRVQVKVNSESRPSAKAAASPANAVSTDPELARQRQENSAAMDQSAAFLRRCVDVWKKQFLSLSEPQQAELLSGETPAYVDL